MSDALNLLCSLFLTPLVRMQTLVFLLAIFLEDLHRLEFLMLFKAVLQQVLVHPQYYTSLYICGNLPRALFHRPYHLSLYQQTQGFWCFLRLFCCRFLFIVRVIRVCINKLRGFWYFGGYFDVCVFSFCICLALSLYSDSLVGSSLVSFHFLDTILRYVLQSSPVITSGCSLRKRSYPLLGAFWDVFATTFVLLHLL